MIQWFWGLSTHSGIYGQGKEQFIDFPVFISNIGAIARNNMAFAITLAFSLLLTAIVSLRLIRGKLKLSDISFRLSIALVLTGVFGILLVAKHYHVNHYLFPVLCLTGILWVWNVRMIKDILRLGKKGLIIIQSIIFLTIILTAWSNKPYLTLADHYYEETNREYELTRKLIESEYKDHVTVVNYPFTIDRINALRWGNVYARQIHLDQLQNIYNDRLFYDRYAQAFTVWESKIDAVRMKEKYGNKLLLAGGIIDDPEKARLAEAGLVLVPVMEGRTQAVYRIDSSSSIFTTSLSVESLSTFCFTMDSLSPDRTFFIASGEKIDAGQTQSTEYSHSGKFSSKLSGDQPYGLPYQLRNLKSGQVYRVSVWRRGDTKNTFLVAAAENTDELYLQTAEPVESGKDKWTQIRMEFTVPEKINGKYIKIYVWNNSGKDVYFDDLTISRIR
jgi:hypothetical protein